MSHSFFRAKIADKPTDVVLIFNNAPVAQMPYQAALAIAEAIKKVALKAQENDPKVMERQADDTAILLKLGVPIGLTGKPEVISEAIKRLPGAGNIPSGSLVPPPTLKKHKPRLSGDGDHHVR